MREITIDKYETTKKYRGVPKGTQVYISHGPSYGLIGEDERSTGMRYVMVTERHPFQDQTYNNFTFPSCMLRNIEETNPDVLNILLKMNKERKENIDNNKFKLLKSIINLPIQRFFGFGIFKESLDNAALDHKTSLKIVEEIFNDEWCEDYFSIEVPDIICMAIALRQSTPSVCKLFSSSKDVLKRVTIDHEYKIEIEINTGDECGCLSLSVEAQKIMPFTFNSIDRI